MTKTQLFTFTLPLWSRELSIRNNSLYSQLVHGLVTAAGFKSGGSRTLARILDSHLADDTLDNEQAEVIFKEHLRGVYKPNIRSILTVSDNFIILLCHKLMHRELFATQIVLVWSFHDNLMDQQREGPWHLYALALDCPSLKFASTFWT